MRTTRRIPGRKRSEWLCDGRGPQAALAARHKVIGLAAFAQGKQKIVGGIWGPFHARQGIDILGELLDLVDQAAGLVVV